jgi:hypothetical protein
VQGVDLPSAVGDALLVALTHRPSGTSTIGRAVRLGIASSPSGRLRAGAPEFVADITASIILKGILARGR